MSNEEDNSNYSNYDEDSFDHESIEENSDEDTISEISEAEQSIEDQLEENIKSLTGCSIDKLSNGDEDAELSSLNSEEDDNAVSECLKKNNHESLEDLQTPTENENLGPTGSDGHEIDETDSDETPELECNVTSSNIQTDKNDPEPEPVHDTQYNDYDDVEHPSDCSQSGIDIDVASQTPTSFNSEDHAFHMDIIRRPTRSNMSIQQGSRNASRKSLSFTNERMWEIERHNQILLRKILTQKPRKESLMCPNLRTTSSAINRKKQQRQIDLDNQVLKRKLEAISLRRSQNLYHL